MKILYVLKLYQNRYYIGLTRNLEKRFNEHLQGKGAEWTRIYKPIDIKTWQKGDFNGFDEDCQTKKFMYDYGINYVRGGTYSNVILLDSQITMLQKEFNHRDGICFRCGRRGHFIKNCYYDTHVNGESLIIKI